MEVVCLSNFDQGPFWMRPFSTNKWGVMLRDGDVKKWLPFANSADNEWFLCWERPDREEGYYVYSPEVTKMTSYAHLVYVYNAETKEFGLYVNGNDSGAKPVTTFDVGHVLSVCGMPYTDREEIAHGWNGKVAIARIYDKAYTLNNIINRYNELKPTIETLNAATINAVE